MKTILCPLDLSPRSDRLLQYVGLLANDRKCKVHLIAVQSAKRKELSHAGVSRQEYGRLDKMHDYLSGIQRVPCGIIQEALTGNFYKRLGTIADTYDIMATAIPSARDEKVREGEIELQKIVYDTLAPVLVIPDRFIYKKVNRLLYAFDYKHEQEPPIMQLHWLSDWFEAEVLFISLSPGDTSLKEENKLSAIQNSIKNSWKGQRGLKFQTIVYPNVPKGLEHYLQLSELNDLLVLSVNHQNILERIWHKSIIKGVLQDAQHPYLVLHK